jgi:hypothetical protein
MPIKTRVRALGQPFGQQEVVMDQEHKSGWDAFTEEIEVAGGQLMEEVNRLLAEGNVRRLQLRSEKGDIFLSIPLTAGAVAGGVVVIAAPWLAVVAAIAGIATKVKLEISREPDAETEARPEAEQDK